MIERKLPSLERAMERGVYASLRSRSRSRRGVDPWVMFHRAGAWYLVGRCHRHDEARLFRLDRIGAVREREG
ncbi:MAG: WYL domain-containing protein, partial [Thermoanaerobaculia bacterium]